MMLPSGGPSGKYTKYWYDHPDIKQSFLWMWAPLYLNMYYISMIIKYLIEYILSFYHINLLCLFCRKNVENIVLACYSFI